MLNSDYIYIHICLIASGLLPPPCMPAACSLQNDTFADFIRCATCVANPSFPRIAPRYFIVFSLVKLIPFSIIVASVVKDGFLLMAQLVVDALVFSPCVSTVLNVIGVTLGIETASEHRGATPIEMFAHIMRERYCHVCSTTRCKTKLGGTGLVLLAHVQDV